MTAMLLTLGVFAFWTGVGHAVLAVLRRGPTSSNLLLAPVVGTSATLLPLFVLNRAGYPVGRIAWPVALSLFAIAVLLWWKARPSLEPRRHGSFAAVLLLALFLTGRPMLAVGFDWLSYCNSDMANYSNSAQRLLTHGFYDVPTAEELIEGTDYSQFYWFFHVPGMVRMGSDMMLSWVMGLTGLSAHQAFMPVILALHLVLISATCALVYRREEYRLAALATAVLLSLSALMTLGVLYQLIAQVFGLALLAGCFVVLTQPTRSSDPVTPSSTQPGGSMPILCQGLLAGLLGATLLLVYPEVVPFLGLAFLGHLAIGIWSRTLAFRPVLGMLGVALLVALILLNDYCPGPVLFLLDQLKAGERGETLLIGLFPYYLVPSGLATLWGMRSTADIGVVEGLLSAKIILGGALLLASLVAAIRLSRKGEPVALMTCLMFAVGAVLWWRRDAFGLFKLAMFVQPFLLAVVVLAWFRLVKRPLPRLVPLLVLGLLSQPGQRAYVRASLGDGYVFAEIVNPSRGKINDELLEAIRQQPIKRLALDSPNKVLVGFQALHLRGIPTTTLACDSFQSLALDGYTNRQASKRRFLRPDMAQACSTLQDALLARGRTRQFDLHDPNDPEARNTFPFIGLGCPNKGRTSISHLVATTPRQSVLNRSRLFGDDQRSIVLLPWNKVANHLVFVRSLYGQYSFGFGGSDVGLFPIEADWFFPGKSMAACGRHLLFEALEPTPGARLVLDFTASLNGDGENRLPPAEVIGTERQPLPLQGRGSARVFSPPLTFQEFDGRHYFSLDMGQDGKRIRYERHGLMRLWGKDVPTDRRYLNGFLRNVSLVSAEEYARLQAPRNLKQFPGDFRNQGLEYAGAYEDGWVSEACYFHLTQPATGSGLVVRGHVPGIKPDFTTELTLMVDGRSVVRQTLYPGDFEIRCQVEGTPARRRVELRFSKHHHLPNGDGRAVVALLKWIGFDEQVSKELAGVPSR